MFIFNYKLSDIRANIYLIIWKMLTLKFQLIGIGMKFERFWDDLPMHRIFLKVVNSYPCCEMYYDEHSFFIIVLRRNIIEGHYFIVM